MTAEGFKRSYAATNSDTARSASSANVATSDSTTAPAAGCVIHRGILRSTPSGPQIVTANSAWREMHEQPRPPNLPADGMGSEP